MKKICFSLVILICGFTVNAQKLKEAAVPVDVKNKFAAMYPNAMEKEWEKEDGKFEVSFKNNKEETSLLFEANGTHVQTEIEIQVSFLPKNIGDFASKKFPGKKINEAAKITAANGTVTYEAEIGGDDYYFDANGNFLNKGKDNEKDDEDRKE